MTADECLLVLKKLRSSLVDDIQDPMLWMETPNPLLNGYKPIDCDLEAVLRLIDGIEGGVYI